MVCDMESEVGHEGWVMKEHQRSSTPLTTRTIILVLVGGHMIVL